MKRAWNSQYRVKAIVDETKQYRYQFSCEWGDGGKIITFVMLNPSVGNQEQEDPTLKKCIAYAKKWGYDGLNVVNLFAYISTEPKELKKQIDPVGPDNDRHVLEAIRNSEKVIVAWGQSIRTAFVKTRIKETLELLNSVDTYTLELTVCGEFPKHPLFLRGDLVPKLFRPATKKVIKVPRRTAPLNAHTSSEGLIGDSDVGLFNDPDWEL
ncbi:DUF1643 domain-containing protein [Exiguobacterium chiriqhucha]|uniref:DUF1643 domain-containing protein n=1 Tax=Exiguobacterium chiriqhucha RW-2 TaxID=1345023 RepID=U1LKF4_9BACL|nr:DUF1643 domain-containing protein [Exiguobacterium chiriqhucha]ERG68013.1 hypothetical protein M467_12050 [Exiguobacterium chiriqhucha RW-2]